MKFRRTLQGRPQVSPFLFLCVLLSLGTGCDIQRRGGPALFSADSLLDDVGQAVPVFPRPVRIVSLAPSITETLFALGLDSSVVGVTDYCDYPASALTKTRVGGMTNPSFETIASLNPDLILLTFAGNSRADYEKLISLGFRVFVSNPGTVENVYRTMQSLGTLTHARPRADSLVKNLTALQISLSDEARQRKTKRVLLLLSLRPIIAAGGNTFLNELLQMANAVNVAEPSPTAYPILSREHILALDPEALLVMNDVAQSPADVIEVYPEWKTLTAVRTNAVTVLDASVLSRPGPRIMKGLELLVRALH